MAMEWRTRAYAETFLVAVVVVRIAWVTLGHRGFDESIPQQFDRQPEHAGDDAVGAWA